MGLFTRKTISFLKFNKRILNNTYIIDSPHNRGDIKTLAWKEDFMKSATKYGTLPSATPQFHPVGHIGRLELLNGGGVCSVVVGIYKNIVRVNGKLYCDMSAPEQAEVDDMKITIAISGRELNRDEIADLWTQLQCADRATVGESLRSFVGNPNCEILKDILQLQTDMTKPMAQFMTHNNETGSTRGGELEMAGRMMYAYYNSSSNGMKNPTNKQLLLWFRSFKIGNSRRDVKSLEEFVNLCKKTTKWLSEQRMLHRDSRSVYLPCFLMFKNHPEMAARFTAYIDDKYPTKMFTFEGEWNYKGKTYKDPCRGGSKEYWRRYMGIVENV